MHKQLRIYVERLKNDHVEKIDETLDPSFLEVHEKDLEFKKPIRLIGTAYLASDHLILELNIHTTAQIPCKICNDPVDVPLEIANVRHTEALSNIKSGVFDFSEEVRDAILLKVPAFVECHGGSCPEREVIKKFLSQ